MLPSKHERAGTGRRLRSRRAGLAAIGLALPLAASALTLGQAFDAALAHDAGYRGAAHELQSVREGLTIARAALLPVASFSAAANSVNGTRTFPNALNQEVRVRQSYEAPQASLSVRVPLLNFDGLAGERVAEAQLAAAEEQYRAQGGDLVDRLVAAYLQLQQAQEVRGLLQTTVSANLTQLSQARQREIRGEGTRVQVSQAVSAVEIARSRLIESELQISLSQRQLTRLTGIAEPVLPADPGVAAAPPETVALNAWFNTALANSPMLRLRERTLEVAKAAVRKQYAGHLPRVDAVGNVSRAENESVTNLGQVSQLRSIGVQLNVPLYSGGAVSAAVRQALARQAQAEEELRGERELLLLDVQRQWQLLQGASKRLTAVNDALQTAELTALGARRSLAAGQGTMADVAEAEAAAQTVRRELLTARTDALLARTRLQVRSGVPMSEIVADLSAVLAQKL
jgi:outer membrane protein, protease secretion system